MTWRTAGDHAVVERRGHDRGQWSRTSLQAGDRREKGSWLEGNVLLRCGDLAALGRDSGGRVSEGSGGEIWRRVEY